MRPLYDAIMGRLTPLGWPVHLFDVPSDARPPFLVVWGPSLPTGGGDDRLIAAKTDVDALVRVTTTAGMTAGVLSIQAAAREALTPGGRTTRLAVPGWSAWLSVGPEGPTPAPDRDVIYPGTDYHPVRGVDLYHLTATPTS